MTISIGLTILRREIGHSVDDGLGDLPVIPLYVCELLDQIVGMPPLKAHHPVQAIAATMAWAIRGNLDYNLIQTARRFDDIIESIDDDDGWPACEWLYAIKCCAIALNGIGMRDRMLGNRWPAQAGAHVANLVLGLGGAFNAEIHQQQKEWLCARLRAAITKAKALVPAA